MMWKIGLTLILVSLGVWGQEPPKYTLQQCVEYALLHSPSLKKQDITVKNQKLQTVIERAQFAFTLTAKDSHATRNGDNTGSVGLSKELESGYTIQTWLNFAREHGQGVTSNYVAVQLSKTLLGGGSELATTFDLEASLVDELEVLNTYNRMSRKLSQDVKIAYYGVINAQQALIVKETALKNAHHTLALTREREKPLDILTAQIRIPENELAVNTAKRNIKNGLDSLKQLMGMPIEEPFEITGEFDYQVKSVDKEKDLGFARENLETFLNNRLERKKLEWQVKIYEEKKLPHLDLSATHYQHGNGEDFNFRGSGEQVLGVNLTWELGRNSDIARFAQYQNKLESNQHDYFILDQELNTNLASYYRRLEESAIAVTLQEKLCDIQKRKEELYRDKWENGEIDILELVRTQSDLESYYVELINRKITYLELLANYEYTVGR